MAIGKNIKGITIEFNGDTTKLGKALSDTDKKTRSLDQQLRQVDRDLKFNPGNTELLAQKQKLLGDKVSETKTRLEALKDAQAKLDDDPAVDKTSQDYMALRREIIETESKLKHFEGQLKAIDNVKFDKVGKQVQNVGNKTKAVGEGMTKYVTGPIVAAGAAATKAFQEVDAGLDIVTQKTGATGEALTAMKDAAGELATEIPTDFETAGTAIGEVNTRFGLTGQKLKDLSAQFIKFAELNGTDVNNAIDQTQKALSAFGLSAEDAGTLLDQLNVVGQNTGVSMETLLSGLVQNGTAFQELGLNAGQAATLMGQLEKSGANSETVMQGLRKALKNAAADGVPLNQALTDLQNKILNGTDSMDGLTAAYDLFGKSGDQIYGAVKNGTLDFSNLGAAASDAAGSVSKTFENTLDPADKFTMTMNQAKLTGYEIGATLLNIVSPALDKIAAVLKTLQEKWDGLSPGVQDAIVKAALVVAAIGPLLIAVGGIITKIGMLITFMPVLLEALPAVGAAFSALAGPVGIAIAAIAAAIAIGVAIYKNWDTIKEKATIIWGAIKKTIVGVWEGIKKAAAKIWDGIKLYFQTVFKIYKTIFTTAWKAIKKVVIDPITAAAKKVREIFDALKDALPEKFDAIKKTVKEKFKAIKDGILTPIRTARDKIKEIIDKIKGFFDFDFELPHIKLPHFSIKPPGWQFSDLLEGSIPSLGIDWYAKGGIFKSPSLIGVGEAGHEGVIPLDPFWAKMDAIQKSTAIDYDQLAAAVARAMANVQVQAQVAIDGKAVGQAVTPTVNRALQNRGVLDGRYA